MRAVIIAGGLGTRLRPLTYERPKAIVPVVNRPFLEHEIDLLRSHGITDIVLNLHYMPELVQETFGDGSRLGVHLTYSVEKEALGTGGAIKLAEPFLDSEPVIVMNGDILIDLNLTHLMAFHKRKGAAVTVTLIRVQDPTQYGLVLMDSVDRILQFVEKPHWDEVKGNTVNAGVYVIEPRVFREIPEGISYSIERDLYPSLLQKGEPMYGFVMDGYWNDIGNPERYLKAHHDILHGEAPFSVPGELLRDQIHVEEGVRIDPSARIHGPCLIGRDADIASGVQIHGSVVIGPNVRIGEGTELRNCVIWENTTIGKNCVLENSIVCGKTHIGDDVSLDRMVLAEESSIKKASRLI